MNDVKELGGFILFRIVRYYITGSQEVASSILASSTNKINNLASSPPSRPLRFSPTFADCLPIPYRESFGNTEGRVTRQVFQNTSG